jgi:hypothetical protein
MTTLGRTGLKVSRLGVGLVEIGRHLKLDDVDEAGRLLNAALDNGINFLDTAECYDVSEELVGRAVSHRRSEYVLATKAGHVAGGYSGEPWAAQTIKDSIDRSLTRMKTDYVDLIQVHAYDIAGPAPEEAVQAVLDAKQAGKARFVGYSQENEAAEWAIGTGAFDTLQTAFSLVDQRARYKLLGLAKAKDMGVIAKRPIANAVWGRVKVDPESYYSTDGVAGQLLERANSMMAQGPIEGAPDNAIELALGFVLAHPEIDTAIVGTCDPAHMLSNIDIVNNRLPLANDVVDELHVRYDRVGKNWRSID